MEIKFNICVILTLKYAFSFIKGSRIGESENSDVPSILNASSAEILRLHARAHNTQTVGGALLCRKLYISSCLVTNNSDILKGTVNRAQICRNEMLNIPEYFNITSDYDALLFIINILSVCYPSNSPTCETRQVAGEIIRLLATAAPFFSHFWWLYKLFNKDLINNSKFYPFPHRTD